MQQDRMERAVEAVQAGSLEDFDFIIDEMQKPIFTYCYHMLGHRQEAEDAVQEVFLKAYEHIDRYTRTVSFSSWLYKIAYNHCINLLKRRKLQQLLPFMRLGMPESASNEGETRVEQEQLSEPLHLALSKLSAAERNILILRVVEEKNYDELALICNKNQAALRKQFERAVKKCKKLLQQRKGGRGYEAYSISR